MRKPEFITVHEGNIKAIHAEQKMSPHFMNGILQGAGDYPAKINDIVCFPWKDAVTQLGDLARDASIESEGSTE